MAACSSHTDKGSVLMQSIKALVKSASKNPLISVIIPLILLVTITSIVNPRFLTPANLSDLVRNISYTFIPSTALTYMVISGNLDLSIGSVLTMGGMACGFVLSKLGYNAGSAAIGLLTALALSALFGYINSLLCVKLKIPTMIATLGMSYVIQGFVMVATGGRPLTYEGTWLLRLGKGYFFGIAYTIIIALVLLVVFHYALAHTTYGRKVMALGGNPEAARLAGIKTGQISSSVYILCSVFAGFAGVLIGCRMSIAVANAGDNKALAFIAGAIIGGNSVYGGRGTIVGTLLGVTIMETITNALVIMRVSTFYQQLFIGLIMILAVAVDAFQTNFKERTTNKTRKVKGKK
jgi:ribose transport system permease protein